MWDKSRLTAWGVLDGPWGIGEDYYEWHELEYPSTPEARANNFLKVHAGSSGYWREPEEGVLGEFSLRYAHDRYRLNA
jgi:hypothetical protein